MCTSCHTKRAVAFAEWLHSTVLWPVAHSQIVLTIPKILRAYFRYDRRLLGDLCRVAAGVIAESFHVLLGQQAAEPGLVICVHTFGNLLNFHPHLHVMDTDGGFTPEGVFHPLSTVSLAPIEELFRHRVFKMLLRKGLLTPERIKLMQTWRHSGFNVNASVRIGVDDATGRENLAHRSNSSTCPGWSDHSLGGVMVVRRVAAQFAALPDAGGARGTTRGGH